jgi:hypothetical protein
MTQALNAKLSFRPERAARSGETRFSTSAAGCPIHAVSWHGLEFARQREPFCLRARLVAQGFSLGSPCRNRLLKKGALAPEVPAFPKEHP